MPLGALVQTLRLDKNVIAISESRTMRKHLSWITPPRKMRSYLIMTLNHVTTKTTSTAPNSQALEIDRLWTATRDVPVSSVCR